MTPLSLAPMKLGYGYDPNVVTLSSLLNGYCHCNRISEAVALVDQMVEMGYQPNTITFNTLIHGLFLNDKVSEAVALVDRMVAKGCQPDLFTYGVVVNGLCKRGEIDLALDLIKKMDKLKFEADVVIYSTVMMVFANTNTSMMHSSSSLKWRRKGLEGMLLLTTPSLAAFAVMEDGGMRLTTQRDD
ncbi:hypothetical protein F2Q68_00019447 [Brassica cretica]|uniref:Pentacotripeptide-repeat region of PRORP domain-containing protein n=2 Tax=Brassica cretica TaxID=69181 RepID=A0A8S9FX01_BRACR|nr:hypothetical protein F2Q68_00019447 [Brassica cretica]KAF3566289.1 hypothetical protein DY000_02012310 [Brassica cretica]